MNFKVLSILAASVVVFASCGGSGSSGKAKLTTEIDSVSYFLGYDYGHGLVTDMGSIPGNPMNFDAMGVGFSDGLNKADMQIIVDDRETYLRAFFTELRTAAADSTSLAGDDGGKTTVKANGMSSLIADRLDSIGYVLGYQYGFSFVDGIIQFPGEEDPNLALVDAGFKVGITNDTTTFAKYDIDTRQFLMEFFQKADAADREKELAPIREKMNAFLEENSKKEGVIVTESGLQYEIIKEGNGPKPTATDRVKVDYTGTTIDGEVFDSSVERGAPAEFGVNQVIRGWTEALQLMPVGSKYKLTIPADLAYGDRAPSEKIGPGSVLVFEVELLDILK